MVDRRIRNLGTTPIRLELRHHVNPSCCCGSRLRWFIHRLVVNGEVPSVDQHPELYVLDEGLGLARYFGSACFTDVGT